MALDTYANLKATILDHIGSRADVTDATVGDFITLAEAQINRRLRCRYMIGRATATITDEYSLAPSDFAGPRSFRFTDTSPITSLEWISPEKMADLKATYNQQPATPAMYTVVGSEFEFNPVPSGSNVAALTYYKRIPALSLAVNWLLTTYPDIYLYGALTQAAPYLIDDPRLPVWDRLYETALADAQEIDKRESIGGQLHVGTPLTSGL